MGELRETLLNMRGDSGFASTELYDVLEEKNCKYTIRLKENATFQRLAGSKDAELFAKIEYLSNAIDYAVVDGEFMYQAGHWEHARRVTFKIEKSAGQFVHLFTFAVTTLHEDRIFASFLERTPHLFMVTS